MERLDSAVVATFIGLQKRLQSAGGRVALCNLGPALAEVFEALRLGQFYWLLLYAIGACVAPVAGSIWLMRRKSEPPI